METFDVGNHVVIELDDERKIAGYIVGLTEDGLLLKATHKECAMVRTLAPAVSADILRQLNEKPVRTLVVAMVLNGKIGSIGLGRDRMVEILAGIIERDLIARKDDGVQLRELANPVLTFVNFGFVKIMEDTEDRVLESEISVFKQTMDADITRLMDKAEQDKAAEAEGPEKDL